MAETAGRLDGRLALVTGASRGIGRATAESLAAEGAFVVGTTTNPRSVGQIGDDLGRRGLGIVFDLASSSDEMEDTLKRTVGTANSLRLERDSSSEAVPFQILVNNGGVKADGPATRTSKEDTDRVLAVNLSGTMELTRQIVRQARKEEYLRVITIGSIASFGHAFQANYAASKAGLLGYMRSLPGEQGKVGGARNTATFNTILPGLIDTDIINSVPEDLLEELVDRIPAGRIGTAEEVARLVTFLALPESGYINGAEITIDGGASAGLPV